MAQKGRSAVARQKKRRTARRRRRHYGHPIARGAARATGKLIYYGVWRIPTWLVIHTAHGVQYVGRQILRNGKGVTHTVAGKLNIPEDMVRCECGEAVPVSRLPQHWMECASRVDWNGGRTEPVQARAERTDRPGPQPIRNRKALPTSAATCPGCNTEFGSRELYRKHLATTTSWKCLHAAARHQNRKARGWTPDPGPALPASPAVGELPTASSSSRNPTKTKASNTVSEPDQWAASSEVLVEPALQSNDDVIEWFKATNKGAHVLTENTAHEMEYMSTIGMPTEIMAIYEEVLQSAMDLEDARKRAYIHAEALWGEVPTLKFD